MSYLTKNKNFSAGFNDKVAAIKIVRAVTGLGLKEAKDAVEDAMDGETVEIHSNFNPRDSLHSQAIADIYTMGFDLSDRPAKTDIILESVKQSAILATKENDVELATVLLGAIKEYEKICEDRKIAAVALAEEQREAKHRENIRQEEREQAQIESRRMAEKLRELENANAYAKREQIRGEYER